MTDKQEEEMFERILARLPKNGRTGTLSLVQIVLVALGPILSGVAAYQSRNTHVAVNSRMDTVVEAATAKGNREGRAEERSEAVAAAILEKPPTHVGPQDASKLAQDLVEWLKKYEQK